MGNPTTLRAIQLVQLPYSVKPILDITDSLLTSSTNPYKMRRFEDITHISVHHSAVEGGTPEGYARAHVNTNGWGGIGYHIVIKGDQIYQTNDLLTFSYHTSSNNAYTVGISVSGDLSKRNLTSQERECLYAAIMTVRSLFNIPVENVMGHNEYPNNNTACPCISMNQVRADLKDLDMKLKYMGSSESKRKNAYAIANQILYMYNMAQGSDGNAEWALNKIIQLEPKMKELGLL
ncbi:hypothetical protein AV654_12470 [Paenibacillus elgii]|uniref:N-acetylmuramoyl-L-alanine amidase domain-containing protein n=1 Tax=Paenibacillus elgii TaxID=189691 RepID=A0A163YU19_9BACL|nr:peptidoglycan recognition family protein [Paenibacillus elgii]KZE80320.1 hypothetical protein AV654_12470 [Paenibacillus elgii]